ncbi:NmrA family NAD(P)-binding protein [Subtercola lobariae]|uniref:Nucleotide-diphosphate-sugar epimerase n=1 Tax=Subtercola lobariae TaxID=1588641 RepID=A0A917B7M8_9MICO|nr:NmrA family NAD(P)-binding protein [Subtercola lobariae]GGF27905.1 nucleotide-diphosphate-sugar epimerase [Subtercola lobariae]
MILVTTAGKVGTQTALTLARSGHDVRVLVRDPQRHEILKDAGAELVEGDLADTVSVAAAVDGVDTVVLVSLAIPDQELRVIECAAATSVGFIVKATSKASADSPIARRRGQSEIEAGLIASGIPHALLRSNAYMQNFLALAPAIATGHLASSAGAGRVGFIDARDVGDVAAAIATAPESHLAKTYWLTGPELLTYGDVAAIFADALDHPVTFATRTRAEDEAAMIEAGVPPTIATQNAQAFSLIADGDAEWLSSDAANLLGRPALSFRAFAADYRPAFAVAH